MKELLEYFLKILDKIVDKIMKKIVTLTFIMCVFYSTNSLCMLRRITYTNKTLKLAFTRQYHGRSYYTNPPISQLPEKNLFNTNDIEHLSRTKIAELAHDLFDRNEQCKNPTKKQGIILQKQNTILALWMTEEDNALNMSELNNLENELKATFPRYMGHANE
jgi:hypothetical protein